MLTVLLIAMSGSTPLDEGKLSKLLGFHGGPEPTSIATPIEPLHARLLGTLRGELSLAALEWDARVLTVSVGQRISDVEIVAIERERVQILRGGRSEWIERGLQVASARPAARQVSISKVLERPEALLGEAQILPAFQGGRLRGFRAAWVKPQSSLAALGLQKGDVLLSVNGVALAEVRNTLELWPQLVSARHLEVTLERGGAIVTEQLDLTP